MASSVVVSQHQLTSHLLPASVRSIAGRFKIMKFVYVFPRPAAGESAQFEFLGFGDALGVVFNREPIVF